MIPLEQNYRSTNTILRAANHVIAHNTERKEKNLYSDLGEGEAVRALETEDEHAEARFVAAQIARLVEEGENGSEIAVFYRTNAQSRVLEDVLVRQDVAYQVIGGPRFYERAEIKDAVAYLQVLDNPADAVSLQRIANRPRRGIGDTTLARLGAHAEAMGVTLFETLDRAEEAGVAGAPLRNVQALWTLLQSLQAAARELTVPEIVERVLEDSGYLDSLDAERTIEAQGRMENLRELVGVTQEYQASAAEPSLSNFLQEISLYSDQDALRDRESLVTLMTLHNAKGLEFKSVFMIGMEEGIFPHSRSIEENTLEEERRLCYVGMTRAQERLTMTHATTRSLYGNRSYNLAFAFPRRAAGGGRGARAAAARLLVVLRRQVVRAEERPARALHRGQRPPRDARRGRRAPGRARRGRDRALRPGRRRAPADARVRAARTHLGSRRGRDLDHRDHLAERGGAAALRRGRDDRLSRDSERARREDVHVAARPGAPVLGARRRRSRRDCGNLRHPHARARRRRAADRRRHARRRALDSPAARRSSRR